METMGCCGHHKECQTTGICHYGNGIILGEMGCHLWNNTISTRFSSLYMLKQKGLVDVESNHLTDLGKSYLFEKVWNSQKDIALILHALYFMGLHSGGSRLSPRSVLQTCGRLKGDLQHVGKTVPNDNPTND